MLGAHFPGQINQHTSSKYGEDKNYAIEHNCRGDGNNLYYLRNILTKKRLHLHVIVNRETAVFLTAMGDLAKRVRS